MLGDDGADDGVSVSKRGYSEDHGTVLEKEHRTTE